MGGYSQSTHEVARPFSGTRTRKIGHISENDEISREILRINTLKTIKESEIRQS